MSGLRETIEQTLNVTYNTPEARSAHETFSKVALLLLDKIERLQKLIEPVVTVKPIKDDDTNSTKGENDGSANSSSRHVD